MRLINKVSWVGAIAGLAISWASTAMAQSAAETAVKEAQKYRGQTITIAWEAGLQALDPLNFSGPKWEELTGIKVKVVELPIAEMFTKIMQEYRAGTGAYDALNVIPASNVDFLWDAAKRLPFRDGAFDVVYASHILEHIPWYNAEQVLAEWVRVVAPGGRLEIWVPDGLKICKAFVDAVSRADRTHLDRRRLRSMLRRQ